MIDTVDALTSPTLKNLREHWWDDAFTEFLAETLRPRPGTASSTSAAARAWPRWHRPAARVADAALSASIWCRPRPLRPSVSPSRTTSASASPRATPPGCPSRTGASTLPSAWPCCSTSPTSRQRSRDRAVTAPGGRVVVVEPDNSARYVFSSLPSGVARSPPPRFFEPWPPRAARPRIRRSVPSLAMMLADARIEPLDVRLFPLSHVRLGCPPQVWAAPRARSAECDYPAGVGPGACQQA